MGWDYNRSLGRAKRKWDETEGLAVAPLVRATDFDKITLKNPRLVRGAHVYVGVPNFRALMGADEPDEEMLRLHHLWARELTRVVETDFAAAKIHFQGPRLHAVVYRPLGDDAKVATTAVLVAAAIRAATYEFNTVHALDAPWGTAAGIDFGDTVATKSGVGGDRELLFLGNAANTAAKIIQTGLRTTPAMAELLDDDVAEHLEQATDGNYRVALTSSDVERLAADRGLAWTRSQSRNRLERDAESVPTGSAKVVDAKSAIDKSRLGLANSKRVDAVSLFADVDGFTAYVAGEQAADRLDGAVRAWHVIRSETRNTLVTDYSGFRVQYQGDRIQGLVYLPVDDTLKAALASVKVAAAMISSTNQVLGQVIGAAAKPLAIGLAAGTTLVSRLGEHGDRDVISLAPATAEAARIQQALTGNVIGVDKTLYERLPAWLTDVFAWDASARAYTAKDLTLDELERMEALDDINNRANSGVLIAVAGAAAVGAAAAAVMSRRQTEAPLRPYAS